MRAVVAADAVKSPFQSAALEEFLDLRRINSEYGCQIHPCKACVSTAMPLCNWPCTCYPNHYMGQIHDGMSELYPRWVAAHGLRESGD